MPACLPRAMLLVGLVAAVSCASPQPPAPLPNMAGFGGQALAAASATPAASASPSPSPSPSASPSSSPKPSPSPTPLTDWDWRQGDVIPFDARAFGATGQRDIFIYNLRLETVRELVGANSRNDEDSPVVSSDRNWIVFNRLIGDQPTTDADLVLYNVKTRLSNPLTNINTEVFAESAPAISNDGRLIVYVSNEDGIATLRLYEVPTHFNYVLANASRGFVFIDSPTISGDGKTIAYAATALGTLESPGQLDIYMYDIQRGERWEPPFVNSPFDENTPSLNTSKMLFASNRFGSFDLFEADFRTGTVENLVLANTPEFDEFQPGYIGEGTNRIYFKVFPDPRNHPLDYLLRLFHHKEGILDTLPIPNRQLLPGLLSPVSTLRRPR